LAVTIAMGIFFWRRGWIGHRGERPKQDHSQHS
jgi:hypothetical protein